MQFVKIGMSADDASSRQPTLRISAIKQQVKRPDRYSIFVNEKYSFSLSADALLDSRIITGQEFTEHELRELKQKSADDKVYNLALRYVAIRTRSHFELETYLKRKDADPGLIEKVIARLAHFGYVDDEAFARSWVENRRLLKAISITRLRLELKQKRVPEDVIRQVLEEDETTDRQTLKEVIARKGKQSRYQDPTKLMQYLARQGYRYDDIKAVLNATDEFDN